jgi:predicted extracellular nuclease
MRLGNGLLILILLVTMLPLAGLPASAAPTELFFSEYIEGSSYNKALEIYNGTGAAIDLSTYTIELYSNGASSPSQTTALSGTLADGDVFVIAHPSAGAAILAAADATNGSVVNFNGDDAVVLKNAGMVADVIGQVGSDPGSYWGSGDVTTQNHTLRRKGIIEAGDTNGSDAFDPASEWDGYPQDTFDGLGTHSTGGGPEPGQSLPLTEGFDDCTLAGWEIVSVDADTAHTWSCNATYSNIDVNGYGDAAPANEWLITPPLNLDAQGNDTLTFRSYTNYTDINYPQLHVLYSTDYAGGGDPTTATWTELSGITFSPAGSGSWTDSGDVDLSGISGTNVYIAFQYVSSGTGGGTAANWRLDAINIFEATPPGQPLPLVEGFDDCTLAGWEILSVDTDTAHTWSCNATYSNIDVNGYGDSAPANEWLITPPLNLDAQGNDTLTFRSYTNYTDSGVPYPQLQVLYSTDYDGGGDPTGATWTALSGITFSPENSGDWTDSGDVDLSGISGTNVYIAFWYQSSGTGGGSAANWRLDAINIFEQAPVSGLVINEVDSDTPSTDVLEFIELYDGGAGNTELDGLVVVLYNGNGDVSYSAFDLDGFATDADGYFVIGSVAGADIDVDPGNSGWLQNGADAVALYSGDVADFPNGTAVTTEDLLDALVYDTNDADDAGLLVLLNAGQSQINEDGSGDKDNHSNQRCPNGEGGPRNTYTYTQFMATPRATNCELPPEVCGDPFTSTYDVQGTGDASPLVGTVVSVEGVVTGDFQGSDELAGFFIQDLSGDGDPATSDGVFVYAPGGADVVVGEHVRVRGTVSEYNGLTEIGYVNLLLSCGETGAVGATVVDLPVPVDLEPYEGMLVTFPEALTASQNYFQGRYGQVTLSSDGRLFVPTNVVLPGSQAIALAQENLRRMIVLDDGQDVSDYGDNPAPIPYIGADDTLRAGDTVAGLTGVIDYGQITAPPDPLYHYRLHPTEEPVTFTRVNERPVAPEDVGGIIKIASFNVLNYFNGNGMGGGFPTSRGADTLEEFIRQRDKIISAILAMNADVIGLMEIENDGYDEYSAIQDLVNGLNEAAGPGTYAFIDPGVAPVGTDEIAVGLIYRPGTIAPVGVAAIIDSSVDPDFNSDYNRPAIAQTFERTAGGGRFTAVVNHLKSKGSSCDAIGDPDIGDGQGNCNLTREAAAIALSEWLATDPTGSGDPDFFIIGDLNSYAMEDPIAAIKDAGYTDLVAWAYDGPWTYSYTFDGQAGYLDHALATADAAWQVMGATIWHINTDEPSVIDYNTEYKPQDLYTPTPYRASDHDPVIVGFCESVPPDAEVTVNRDTLWPPNHKYVRIKATVEAFDNLDPDPTVALLSVTSDEPDEGLDDEDLPVDIVIVDDYTFKLRAERWEEGDGRTYTITYQVTDSCGNTTVETATVTVPHDLGSEED